MHIQTIRKIAREMEIKGPKTKVDLVRAIQRAEGNFPCFATASSGFCDRSDCLWRQDCLSQTR